MTSTTVTATPYHRSMGPEHADHWPAAGTRLLNELRAGRRPALIAAPQPAAEALALRLTVDLDLVAVSLGPILAARPDAPTGDGITPALANATVLTRLDVALWPDLGIDLLALLRQRARLRPTIAIWPGEITHGRATYSQPGRPDHVDRTVTDVLLLRPAPTTFPDEVPYTVERIA